MSELLHFIRNTLSDRLGQDIATIDMRKVNPFNDYYVIVTADNLRHADAMATRLEQEAAEKGYFMRMREGVNGSDWILLDFNEVVVHIFTDEARKKYRLESLWADQPVTREI